MNFAHLNGTARYFLTDVTNPGTKSASGGYASLALKLVQFVRAQSKFTAEDFLVVLSQDRCGCCRCSIAVDNERAPRLFERPENRMSDGTEKAARFDMGIFHEIARRVDRQARDAVLLQQLRQIFFQEPGGKRRYLRVDVVGVGAPQITVDPFWIVECRIVVFPDLQQ